MRVLHIWRFPVKSLQGERLDAAAVTAQGLDGDRRYAIFDTETGLGLTARRTPELLFGSARIRTDGSVEITLPDGNIATNDAQLSTWLGRPVTLRSTRNGVSRRYENPSNFEDEVGAAWDVFDGSAGAFHDSGRANVSLVSEQTMRAWDPRRFRTNLVVDGSGEDRLVNSRLRVGDAIVRVEMQIDRCVMTTRPQPGGLERDLDVLRTIHRERGGQLAIGATVVQPGRLAVGDTVEPLRAWGARLRSVLAQPGVRG